MCWGHGDRQTRNSTGGGEDEERGEQEDKTKAGGNKRRYYISFATSRNPSLFAPWNARFTASEEKPGPSDVAGSVR